MRDLPLTDEQKRVIYLLEKVISQVKRDRNIQDENQYGLATSRDLIKVNYYRR